MWKNFASKNQISKQCLSCMLIAKEWCIKNLFQKAEWLTKEFYLEVLSHLLERIACIRTEVWKNCSFSLLRDNAPVHTSTIVQKFLKKKRVPVFSHPAYSTGVSSGPLCVPQIENGIERWPVQKYFREIEVCAGKIEGDTYSWVGESNERT